jgi:hypothetical protein
VAADANRRDGWAVTYQVDVLFDTNNGRTRYDHIGTLARCTCCGERIDLRGSPIALEHHARVHERHLSTQDSSGEHPTEAAYTTVTMADFSTDDAKEVTVRG